MSSVPWMTSVVWVLMAVRCLPPSTIRFLLLIVKSSGTGAQPAYRSVTAALHLRRYCRPLQFTRVESADVLDRLPGVGAGRQARARVLEPGSQVAELPGGVEIAR